MVSDRLKGAGNLRLFCLERQRIGPKRVVTRATLCLSLLSMAAGAAYANGTKAPAQPVLTTVEQVRAITPENAALGTKVHLKGIVTLTTPSRRNFWIQDETGAVYAFSPEKSGTGKVKAGDRVEVYGVTDPGNFGPCVKQSDVRIVSPGELPAPKILPIDNLIRGANDGAWVQLTGHVVSLSAQEDGTPKITLMVYGYRLPVILMDTLPYEAATLIDTEIRISGVTSLNFNRFRQFTGVVLNAYGLKDIQVLKPAGSIPKLTQIIDLLRYKAGGGAGTGRAKVEGYVTFYQPGRSLIVQDRGQAVSAQVSQPDGLRLGDKVAVIGYPRARDFTPILNDAAFKRVEGVTREIQPADISIEDALTGESDTELIRVSGTLIDYTIAPDREVLNLRSGDIVFTADWDQEDQSTRPTPPEKGSLISVTGICKVALSGSQRRTRSLRILLRKPADVQLVESPSWFTRQRLYQIALILGAIILGALIWVWLLRRRVNAQTEVLRQRLLREAELEESYSNIFKNASDVIYTHDRRGHILAMNRAGEKFFGFSAIELLTMNFSDLLAAGQRDRFDRWISTIEDDSSAPCEFEFTTKSGAHPTLELSVHPVTQHGRTEYDGIARDVTERKQAQAALEQAKGAAEAATLAKTRFLANMSHEIRTPLNSIIGMADSLAQTELSDQQRDYVSLFQRSGENLLGLINSILDLSRVESGQVQLEKRPFSLSALVQSVMKLLSRQASANGIDLTSRISDGVPAQIVGDEERLRQVLMNLAGNALKFTERGSVTIAVHSYQDVSHSGSSAVLLRFEVADTGIGIPANRIDAIFESFTQADASTTRKYGGTGLGLSIARGLVQLMGGQMGVESQPGGGSKFIFTIPCETVAEIAPAVEPVKDLKELMHQLPADWSAKILLAEDSEANRLVIAAYLQKLPVEMAWAPNGTTAYEMACKESYDLILMDIQMPEMDGYEATRRIRECERERGSRRTPILALTAHAFSEEAENCIQAGCDAMLTKPIRRKVLLRAIYEYSQVRGLAGQTQNE